MAGFSDANIKTGSNKGPKFKELVKIHEFEPGEWELLRFLGPLHSWATAWIDIVTKAGKKTRIPYNCLDYNAETGEFDKNICPVRDRFPELRFSIRWFCNAIVRSLQDQEPKNPGKPTPKEAKLRTILGYEAYWKESPSTKIWTPVRVISMPSMAANKLKNLGNLNTDPKTGKKYDILDPDFGIDVNMMCDPEAKAAAWEVQKDERTPLTDEELDYPLWNLDQIPLLTLSEAKDFAKFLDTAMIVDNKDGNGKKKSKRDDDIDDDDDPPFEDFDDDDRPAKKKAAPKRKANIDFDDDEDEPPRKKARPANKKKNAARLRDDDDLDDADFDDDIPY